MLAAEKIAAVILSGSIWKIVLCDLQPAEGDVFSRGRPH
jgi:hypothetical protein